MHRDFPLVGRWTHTHTHTDTHTQTHTQMNFSEAIDRSFIAMHIIDIVLCLIFCFIQNFSLDIVTGEFPVWDKNERHDFYLLLLILFYLLLNAVLEQSSVLTNQHCLCRSCSFPKMYLTNNFSSACARRLDPVSHQSVCLWWIFMVLLTLWRWSPPTPSGPGEHAVVNIKNLIKLQTPPVRS